MMAAWPVEGKRANAEPRPPIPSRGPRGALDTPVSLDQTRMCCVDQSAASARLIAAIPTHDPASVATSWAFTSWNELAGAMDLDEAIRELRARNEPVPRPLRLPTPAEVAEAERRLSLPFPPDFRRYLLEASDVICGAIEPVTITRPQSHTDLFEVAENAWGNLGLPRDLLPICEDNSDFYCMDPTGEVVFWSHDGWSSGRWRSLAEWITQVWLAEYDDT